MMYAIVRVNTDARHTIVTYSFINEPAEGIKNGFKFLTGYRFPKTMRINKHPIVFYLSIDNTESCHEKPGDLRFYAPNRVVNIIASYCFKILRDDLQTIFIPNLIIKSYYPVQQ